VCSAVPAARAELHFHLLPGVDDGPADMAEAIDLARLAVADGTGLVVCTPHMASVVAAELPERVAELRGALERARVALEVRCGGELAWRDVAGLDAAALDLIAHGPPGRRWVLLEAPLGPGRIDLFRAAAAELRAHGLGVLIGHPERSPELMAHDGALGAEVKAGAALQVNASSVCGRHGRGAQAAALDLLRAGRVVALSSDAHGAWRPPVLRAAVRALAAAGIDADALTGSGPRELLAHGLPERERADGTGAG